MWQNVTWFTPLSKPCWDFLRAKERFASCTSHWPFLETWHALGKLHQWERGITVCRNSDTHFLKKGTLQLSVSSWSQILQLSGESWVSAVEEVGKWAFLCDTAQLGSPWKWSWRFSLQLCVPLFPYCISQETGYFSLSTDLNELPTLLLMVTTTVDDHVHENTRKYFVDFYWKHRDGAPFI